MQSCFVLFLNVMFWSFQEAYVSVVEYFGENPKTTQPSMFFPPFGRFIKAYKVRNCSLLSAISDSHQFSPLLNFDCMTECRRHSRRLNRGRKWRANNSKRHRHHHQPLPARGHHKRFPTRWRCLPNFFCCVLCSIQSIDCNHFSISRVLWCQRCHRWTW